MVSKTLIEKIEQKALALVSIRFCARTLIFIGTAANFPKANA